MKKKKLKCQCCDDWLEITEGDGQIHFQMHIEKWNLWSRVKFAIGAILKPSVYKDGGMIWISPKRWKNFIDKL
uniref:Uncharacterized protein n=1 Tax=viral metagenome TaxID=1070528 RepID=A0A6M3JDN2_9ZZZZ